jgi:hypothetical protein
MKKMILGTSLLTMMSLIPLPTIAGLHIDIPAPPSIHINIPPPPSIRIGVPMPPHIEFSAPPRLVVVPETYVYVAPDVEEEIFFSDGWWYRPWEGRWYRSRNHSSGWQHYRSTPSFYSQIPSGWRNDYREGHWRGQQWNIRPIPHTQVQKNWRSWKTNNHWERQQSWGVENLERQRGSRHPSERGRGNHSNSHERNQR